ncbi:hypothetical protein BDN71DRAFT_1431776 [Pleurotus eryngii]|uniref:Uncharacterized protein n=1 Tax=Pleurotus eryngii TaxID=5323 RepID=A0A9P6D7Q9_PLEER|nr:hypothetical protein BDN71DRAFT_1431776 [Pleurotus eryngii]
MVCGPQCNDAGSFTQNPKGFPSTTPFPTGRNLAQPIGTFPTGQLTSGESTRFRMEPLDYQGTCATSVHGNTLSQQSMVQLPPESIHSNEQMGGTNRYVNPGHQALRSLQQALHVSSLGTPGPNCDEDDHTSQWVDNHAPSFMTMEQLDDRLKAFAMTITRTI